VVYFLLELDTAEYKYDKNYQYFRGTYCPHRQVTSVVEEHNYSCAVTL